MQNMILVKTDGGHDAIQPSAVERVAKARIGDTCVVYFSGSSNYLTVHEPMEDIVKRINGALHSQEGWLEEVLSSIRR